MGSNIKRRILVLVATLATAQAGCSKSGSNDSSSVAIASSVSGFASQAKTTVSSAGVSLSGSEYGMARLPSIYTVAAPAGASVVSAVWNFGDATAPVSSVGPVSHTYNSPGSYTVDVAVLDSNGNTSQFSRALEIIPLLDGFECVTQLGINSPTEGTVGVAVPFSSTIPLCVGSRVSALVWNFGDGTGDTALTTQHAYANPGTYHVTLSISVIGAPVPNPMFVLSQDVVIVAVVPPPPPTPLPNACTVNGSTRTSTGENFTEEKSCGVNGHRTDTYHNVIIETCKIKPGSEVLTWQPTSSTKELVSEGQCQGQACELPAEAMAGVGAVAAGVIVRNGHYYLAEGGSLKFYSTQSPEGLCSSVEEARTCSNGVLNGSSEHKFLLCFNGCTGFGPNGTVKSGVITGEVSVAKTCQFAETGFFDQFYQIADQTCNLGTVVTSNSRRGGLKSEGVCPTYAWTATGEYSVCSAACGGEQSLGFVCMDNSGKLASADHCAGTAPVERRVCDGNPDSVKRSESQVTTDEGGSSNSCPKNQIGVISKSREMTKTVTYACIDHSVQQASEDVTYGPWTEENYCRDYVAHRCSQDSLSTTKAKGRYKWMVKCASEVPVIKEFLEKFDVVETKSGGYEISGSKRLLYPTFMIRNQTNSKGQSCEKPWIAPTDEKADCEVPSTAYVAAVCLSSCATPEQQIMAKNKANGKMGYVPFVDAWQDNFAFVATLGSQSSMSSKQVQKTRVDQWVTELIDTDHVILEFKMASGGALRLTPNHPVLTADAYMRLAGELKVGDKMVRLGGVADEIVSIVETNYFGKVYNVLVKSADLHKNIVITNGYLNGTAMYQNEGAKYVNTQVFRNHLIRGVFPK